MNKPNKLTSPHMNKPINLTYVFGVLSKLKKVFGYRNKKSLTFVLI